MCPIEGHLGPDAVPIPFEKSETEGSILQRFARVVRYNPSWLAVKTDDRALSYEELDEAASQVAQALLEVLGEGSEVVAMLLEHGAAPIIALMGILKAGKIYLALDRSQPPARHLEILREAQAHSIVTDSANLLLAAELAQNDYQLVNMDEAARHATGWSEVSVGPDSLAALFYTSGSTGEPKLVERSHRNVLHYAWSNARDHQIRPSDRHTLLSSCSFGASAIDTFLTLLSGATLYPYRAEAHLPSQMIDWLNQNEITFLHPPVTLFRQLLDALPEEQRLPAVRRLILSGQTVYPRDVARFRRGFPRDCVLVHRFGLTETGPLVHYLIDHSTKLEKDVVPAGFATADKGVFLLDEAGNRVGYNRIGEITVKSRYLSPGYWRKPELTAAAYATDPDGGNERIYRTGDLGRMWPDGCLEHFGRKDFQVKIRGYRVEVVAVEVALHALEGIEDAVVVAVDDVNAEKALVAYVVPSTLPAPSTSALRSSLAETLPSYMIPSAFVALDRLPLTPTGKVDRQALPALDRSRPELEQDLIAPRTHVEKVIAGVWAQVLDLQQVGIYDNFFELGGHSLLATQVVSRLRDRLHVELPLRTLFETPTIAHLAQIVEETWRDGRAPQVAAVRPLPRELRSVTVASSSDLSIADGPGKGS